MVVCVWFGFELELAWLCDPCFGISSYSRHASSGTGDSELICIKGNRYTSIHKEDYSLLHLSNIRYIYIYTYNCHDDIYTH